MLNRKIDNEIDVHFSSSKKALYLTGARPVGKTCSGSGGKPCVLRIDFL